MYLERLKAYSSVLECVFLSTLHREPTRYLIIEGKHNLIEYQFRHLRKLLAFVRSNGFTVALSVILDI
jgi:hypothetical protein